MIDLECRAVEEDVAKTTSSRILAESLLTLSHVLNAEAGEAEAVAMETLFDAHHPSIGIVSDFSWYFFVY